MTGTDEAHTLADGLFQNLVKNASEREGSVLTPFNVRVTAAAVSAVAALVSVFFGDGLHMFLGLLLGCGIAELLFLQNERSIEQQLDNPEKAGMIARRDYLVRLVVRIAAVVVGWLNPFTNIIGVIIGLLSITIAIYILTFVSAWQLKKEEQAAAQESLEVIRDGVSKRNATGSSTLVRSTITGLILDIPVKVGNSVIQANTMNDGTTVATVANMSDLIFDGNIDETEVGTLVEGMPMQISIGAIADYSTQAALEYISPKAVENNGANQFEIKAAVKADGDKMIRSGYSANAEIVLERADSVLVIPESALEFEGADTFVHLKGEDGEYVKTPVTTGLSDGINIEIRSGLAEGDIVRGSRIIMDKKGKEGPKK